jgi:hypothetical protein
MQGYINKEDILQSYRNKSDLDKFEAITAVINEVLPEYHLDVMALEDYYHTIFTVWNIIESNETRN